MASEKYTKLSQREHVLCRPGMYIGSTTPQIEERFILNDAHDKLEKRDILYSPALYKIFDEIIVNAIDHSVNDTNVNQIKVSIDKETGEISVYNNGNGISVEIHKKEKIYIPELIFGHLLTSSSFKNTNNTTGSVNGLGSKLTNIFSTKFTVETVDSVNKKKYIQTFENNLEIIGKPKITKATVTKPYTKITFIPDYKRLKIKMNKNIMLLFEKRVYDLVACLPRNKMKVYFQNELIPVKTFSKYCELYTDEKIVYENFNESWDIGCAVSNDGFQHISFVNGVVTTDGGTHVDNIVNQISKKITEKLKKGTRSVIKNYIYLFLRSTIVNPSFNSQTKEKLTTKASEFGFSVKVSDKFINSFVKNTTIGDKVNAMLKFKEESQLKKTSDGSKKTRITGIPKLDDAKWAGTKNSDKCTLILTEGDSAKAFAVSGISVIGRDYYGIYPLKGKLLNVREASNNQLINNNEITELKQILGLQHGEIYKDASKLRYGSVMLLVDSDVDGHHIKGLGINFFHYFWKELVDIPGFIKGFYTPIIKATKGKNIKTFYTLTDFDNWKQQNNTQSWKIKYYKGLGTSTASEAKEYFKDIDNHQVIYFSNSVKDTEKYITLAFDKKQSDNRKKWISKYDKNQINEYSEKKVSISDFINKDMIHFSVYDNERSIPSICDGLKISQRKILWSCFKRNLVEEIKVAQLAGYISEHAGYHHGELSLSGAIVNMAQNYTGSNNMNILAPNGQFGTRNQNGKDHASARYIYTKLSEWAKNVYNPLDSVLLTHVKDDDGKFVEPEYYLPMLPMILINGCDGIGTGFSTYIPNFNPDDIKEYVMDKINNKPLKKEIIPWYKGFNGRILKEKQGTYKVYGCFTKKNTNTIVITELPVGKGKCNKSFHGYKEFLEKCIKNNIVKKYYSESTDEHPLFTVTSVNKLPVDEEEIYKMFNLVHTINTNNMHLFDENKQMTKFNSPTEIIDHYYKLRISLYEKRRLHLIKVHTNKLSLLNNKMRFLTDIISETIVIYRKTKQQIDELLFEHNYDKIDNSFCYLTDMKIHSFTKENLEKLKKECNNERCSIDFYKTTTNTNMWITDLNGKC